MCGLVAASIITTMVSTGLSVAQSVQQSKEQSATAEYNARVYENDAQNVRNEATDAENTLRSETTRLVSKQRAEIGAANIDLTSGSALQLQEDTVLLGEADALKIRETGDSQYDSLIEQSKLESSKADSAETQGILNIGSSLLSGASSITGSGVADKWFT